MNPKNYTRTILDIDVIEMRQLEKINSFIAFRDLFILYFFTIFIVSLGIYLTVEFSWFFYPLVIFFIAGRQGAFLQLIHEASHNLISENYKINNFFGSWLTSFLVGVNFEGYTSGHKSHHSSVSTPEEPEADSEKYVTVDFKSVRIYFLFLKDLLGITALKIFFDYGNNKSGEKFSTKVNFLSSKKIFFLFKLSIVQLLILALFKFNIFYYFFFWLYPAMGPHMFLMRIRGIAEHGLSKQMSYLVTSPAEGMYFTRSFLTKVNTYKYFNILNIVEKLLIGSFSVHYHHEHHLNARIPYYNLKKFHKLTKDQIINKVKVPIYEKGYFSAALRTVLVPESELTYKFY